MFEKIHMATRMPADYHCTCDYCKKMVGELIRADGTNYSRNDRRRYYSDVELASVSEKAGHIAKTPLHIARWAVQHYSKPGDWVLDPMAGAGTTLVEALTHDRNAVGIEIEFHDVTKLNAKRVLELVKFNKGGKYAVVPGDARQTDKHLVRLFDEKPSFALIVNNPPYWGDQSQKAQGGAGYEYDKTLNNLAFLKEGEQYFEQLGLIYAQCTQYLKRGGHFVIGIKDQMRNKKPDLLHMKVGDVIGALPGMRYVCGVVLRHFPTTLFLNTYEKQTGVRPPLFQSILVFKKG